MKTKIKNDPANPLGACGTDTNPPKRYDVTVYRTEYLWCRIRVQSIHEKEAEQIGDDLASDQGKWETADAEQYVHSVELVQEGGEDHE